MELFCRCLTAAPQTTAVLNLRGAPAGYDDDAVDTVLQRIVMLCHHELLCLGIHGSSGGPWRDQALLDVAERRLRICELALLALSSFAWQIAPWAPDVPEAEGRAARAQACAALGRTRPLLASIVD